MEGEKAIITKHLPISNDPDESFDFGRQRHVKQIYGGHSLIGLNRRGSAKNLMDISM